MSLLMDALKKAELAKRQGADSGADGSPDGSPEDMGFGGLALEPMAEAATALPGAEAELAAKAESVTEPPMSLASHLEELDARFLEEAAAAARIVPTPSIATTKVDAIPPPSPPPAPAAESYSRPLPAALVESPRRAPPDADDAPVKAAAQNLFAAKQPEKQESRKGFAIAIGVLTVLSVTGIGGYFWWQLQPKSSMMAKPMAPPPAPAVPQAPPAAPALVAGVPTQAPPPASQPPATAGPASASGPATTSSPRQGVVANDDDGSAASSRTRPRRQSARAVDAVDDDNPIRVTRQPLRIDPALNRGFEAFNRGELSLAQLEYERARKNDPRNTDVLHGLAAIAMRQGRHDQAETLYRQIIESDPQDTVAISALLNQRGQIDPGLTESRLKSLAAEQPDLAAPHFSLGNLYARMGRWSEAQQAYFRAFSAEPDNPDILYNLAISLEHLRQNKLAAQYYGQAVAAAASRPAGFDRDQAAARLKALQP